MSSFHVQASTISGDDLVIYGCSCGKIAQGDQLTWTAADGSTVTAIATASDRVPAGVWMGPDRLRTSKAHAQPKPGSAICAQAAVIDVFDDDDLLIAA